MTALVRDLEAGSANNVDLIIIGGGIYGVMLSLEAVRRNLKPLMLEKNDFCSATSLNHLRTLHGGLRYLQTLDLPRFKESVGERKWFLKYFPQYASPMPCLMPLYGNGLHRNSVLSAALLVNDILSFNRNKGVRKDRYLPKGKVISAERTRELFPDVDGAGLKGSALWYDAGVHEFQRLTMEAVKLAAASGAKFLNYVEAGELLKEKNRVTGVRATDRETGNQFQFHAPVVINAAGPWCRDIAARFDKDHPSLFQKRLLLWNVLFKKQAFSDYALGLTPGKGKGHSYFFHPWKNRLLVGTGEALVEKNDDNFPGTSVPPLEMERFIADINKMVPGLKLTGDHIQRVYSGILPANPDGGLAKREAIYDHSTNGGPPGLFSISGVKFTTSRLVAEKTLNLVFPRASAMPYDELLTRMEPGNLSFGYDWEPGGQKDLELLKMIVREESVLHLGDLLIRRTSLADHPERAIRILPKIKPVFDWDQHKWENEVKQFKREMTNKKGNEVTKS